LTFGLGLRSGDGWLSRVLLWRGSTLTATIGTTTFASASAITTVPAITAIATIAATTALPVAAISATIAAILRLLVSGFSNESFVILVGGSSGTAPIAATSAVATSPVRIATSVSTFKTFDVHRAIATMTSATTPVVTSSWFTFSNSFILFLIVVIFLDLLATVFFSFFFIVLRVLLRLSVVDLALFLMGSCFLLGGFMGCFLSFGLFSALGKLLICDSLVSFRKERRVAK
jgi:hypothetical protein